MALAWWLGVTHCLHHVPYPHLRSKINAAMAKLAAVDKDLADQGLEKVLTQLDKVPGA